MSGGYNYRVDIQEEMTVKLYQLRFLNLMRDLKLVKLETYYKATWAR